MCDSFYFKNGISWWLELLSEEYFRIVQYIFSLWFSISCERVLKSLYPILIQFFQFCMWILCYAYFLVERKKCCKNVWVLSKFLKNIRIRSLQYTQSWHRFWNIRFLYWKPNSINNLSYLHTDQFFNHIWP